MEIKFKDVCHLYYGVEAVGTDMRDGESTRGKIIEINQSGITILENPFDFEFLVQEVKPILSRLEDMTEEDFNEFKKITEDDFSKKVAVPSVKVMQTTLVHKMDHVAFLLRKGYDLFNLIPSGEAIDRKIL